jgi:4-amino-4-deoxy-L-arabinose transferase-like glycosyltransferase
MIPLIYGIVDDTPDGNYYGSTAVEWAKNGINLEPELDSRFVASEITWVQRFRATLLVVYPVAIFIKIFGLNYFSAIAYSLFSTLGTCILMFLIGKLLFNDFVARFSVLQYLSLPIVSYLNGRVLCDSYSPFYLLLIFYSALHFLWKEPKYSLGILILIGIGTTLATLVRQWLPITVVSVVSIVILLCNESKNDKMKHLVSYFIGVILGIGLVVLIGWFLTGKLDYYYGLYTKYSEVLMQENQGSYFWNEPLFVWRMLFQPRFSSFFIYLLLLGMLILLSRNNTRNERIIIFCVLCIYLFTELPLRLIFSLPLYAPYISTILPFACIIVSDALYYLFKKDAKSANNIIYLGTLFLFLNIVLPGALCLFPVNDNEAIQSFVFGKIFNLDYRLTQYRFYGVIFITLIVAAFWVRTFSKRREINYRFVKATYVSLVFLVISLSVIISSAYINHYSTMSQQRKEMAKVLINIDNPRLFNILEGNKLGLEPNYSSGSRNRLINIIESYRKNNQSAGVHAWYPYNIFDTNDMPTNGYLIVSSHSLSSYQKKFDELKAGYKVIKELSKLCLINIYSKKISD